MAPATVAGRPRRGVRVPRRYRALPALTLLVVALVAARWGWLALETVLLNLGAVVSHFGKLTVLECLAGLAGHFGYVVAEEALGWAFDALLVSFLAQWTQAYGPRGAAVWVWAYWTWFRMPMAAAAPEGVAITRAPTRLTFRVVCLATALLVTWAVERWRRGRGATTGTARLADVQAYVGALPKGVDEALAAAQAAAVALMRADGYQPCRPDQCCGGPGLAPLCALEDDPFEFARPKAVRPWLALLLSALRWVAPFPAALALRHPPTPVYGLGVQLHGVAYNEGSWSVSLDTSGRPVLRTKRASVRASTICPGVSRSVVEVREGPISWLFLLEVQPFAGTPLCLYRLAPVGYRAHAEWSVRVERWLGWPPSLPLDAATRRLACAVISPVEWMVQAYHSGGVCARVINGGRDVAIAYCGSPCEEVVSYATFRSAITRYRMAKSHPAGSLALALGDAPGNRELYPMVACIADAYVAGQRLCGETAEQVALSFDDSYRCMPDVNFTAVYIGDDLDSVRSVGAVVSRPVDARGALAASSRSNELRTITSRVVQVANDKIPPRKYTEYAREFVATCVPNDQCGKLAPLDPQDVFARMNRPSQVTNRVERETTFDILTPLNIAAFQKLEGLAAVNDPRNISPLDATRLTRYARFMLAAGDYMRNLPWYAFGSGSGKTARRVQAICQEYDRVHLTDFSRFDGTRSGFLASFELALYRRLFPRSCREELDGLFTGLLGALAATRHGVRYSTGPSRVSGENGTAVGNTIDCAFVAYCGMREAGQSREEAWSHLGLYGGDDGFTPATFPADKYRQAARDLGLRLEIVESPTTQPLEFFGRLYPMPRLTACSMYTLGRMLPRMHFVTVRDDVPQALVNRAHGLLLTDPETPVLREYAHSILRAYPRVVPAVDIEERWFYENYDLEDPYPPLDISPEDALRIQAEYCGYEYEALCVLQRWLETHPYFVGCVPPLVRGDETVDKFAYYRDGVLHGILTPPPKVRLPREGYAHKLRVRVKRDATALGAEAADGQA